MHNTLFIIVAYLGDFIKKLIAKFSYCALTALICEKITFGKYDQRYQDILDNFVVNIKIFLNALSYTSKNYIIQ